jgi:hypothetical protein
LPSCSNMVPGRRCWSMMIHPRQNPESDIAESRWSCLNFRRSNLRTIEDSHNAQKMQFRNFGAPAGIVPFRDARLTVICLWARKMKEMYRVKRWPQLFQYREICHLIEGDADLMWGEVLSNSGIGESCQIVRAMYSVPSIWSIHKFQNDWGVSQCSENAVQKLRCTCRHCTFPWRSTYRDMFVSEVNIKNGENETLALAVRISGNPPIDWLHVRWGVVKFRERMVVSNSSSDIFHPLNLRHSQISEHLRHSHNPHKMRFTNFDAPAGVIAFLHVQINVTCLWEQ